MSGIERERITGDERRCLNGWTGHEADRFVETVGDYARFSGRPVAEIVAMLALARSKDSRERVSGFRSEFSDSEADELRCVARERQSARILAVILFVALGAFFLYAQCDLAR